MARKSDDAPDPTAIGDVSSPPFARLPDPATLFACRAARFRRLAETSDLASYLNFVAGLSQAQHDIQSALPPPAAADIDAVRQARAFEMPPIDRNGVEHDEAATLVFDRLFAAAKAIEKPVAASEALRRITAANSATRFGLAQTIFAGILPSNAIAEGIFVWAALQVHFSRLASVLDAAALVPVADGICPACGGMPASSMVVGWPGSHGARFCTCSLCSTAWHFVRIKCVLCGSTKGIGYQEVEGLGGSTKAETCDACHGWSKIFYQTTDPAVDPVADDAASLGLDLLMRELPYHRGGFAPLLAGL